MYCYIAILDFNVLISFLHIYFRIPYIFSASTQLPGKFMLGYLPRKPTIYEFVTVTPEGIRYRGHVHHSLNSLVRWFKEHFRDPIPGKLFLTMPCYYILLDVKMRQRGSGLMH